MTYEWMFLYLLLALLAFYLGRDLERIRELMEGPTERCRFCQRRYVTDLLGFRVCSRRGCQKRYAKYYQRVEAAERAGNEEEVRVLKDNFEKGI